ncbi:glycerophosphodiester phosphodiesterase [Salinigranum halophilum]|uniref:glycerophosphodiester phosphodiesterase n=1 Tax=Salinigranum halophilum TaxID=2565931 RepID=UPI0010A91FFB|nr:glycerophosphodiester phosphodiesterase [Salinigranum halophilum]
MRLIAHRGCAARGPENTVCAIERALPHVDAVEVDVRRCGSGELVVVHDATLGRLTGLDRPVSAVDYETLRSYAVLDSDQSIPRLTDVVDALPADVGLNVELKERGLAADVETAVADHPEVWVSSFDATALAETHLPRAFLFAGDGDGDGADDWTAGVATARDLDCVAVHPQYDLVVDTPERVADAHDAGLAVNAWTPPPAVVPRLRRAAVDGVIVDDWTVDG